MVNNVTLQQFNHHTNYKDLSDTTPPHLMNTKVKMVWLYKAISTCTSQVNFGQSVFLSR